MLNLTQISAYYNRTYYTNIQSNDQQIPLFQTPLFSITTQQNKKKERKLPNEISLNNSTSQILNENISINTSIISQNIINNSISNINNINSINSNNYKIKENEMNQISIEEEIPKKQTPVILPSEDTNDDSSTDIVSMNDIEDFKRTFKIIQSVINQTMTECSEYQSSDITSTSSSLQCIKDDSFDELENYSSYNSVYNNNYQKYNKYKKMNKDNDSNTTENEDNELENDLHDIDTEITNEITLDIQNKKHSHFQSKRTIQKHVVLQNNDPFEVEKRKKVKNYKNWRRKKNKKQSKEPNKYIIELVKIGIGIIIIVLCCCLVWKSHTEMLVM